MGTYTITVVVADWAVVTLLVLATVCAVLSLIRTVLDFWLIRLREKLVNTTTKDKQQ